MGVEAYIVVIRENGDKRTASRHPLHVPVDAARGCFHQLSDRALNDLIKDLTHEQMRRQDWL
jgi:hypothetical protein